MVKVELSYNPYVRETIVKFNGQEPRVNSLIEKYKKSILQDWIDKLPSILYDEMNGYGFEFLFSGLEDDFKRIRAAFRRAGVPEGEVCFIHKNTLDNPVEKNKQINELLNWISSNPNRRFDYDAFKEKYKDILETPFSFITINGENAESITLSNESINIENIENVEELSSSDITNIPIVMYINSLDIVEIRKSLQMVICREDINNKQLFFCIRSLGNRAQVERIIYDLGIENPAIIKGLGDDRIKEYFEVYSLTEYIKNMLDIFRTEAKNVKKVLSAENLKNQKVNTEIYGKIHRFENDIRLLKIANEKYQQRDNFVVPEEYNRAIESFSAKVAEWRNKKVNTHSVEDALKMANELNKELEKYYAEFVDFIDKTSIEKSESIDELFSSWFSETRVEPDYKPVLDFNYEAKSYITPKLVDKFMELKTERYVDPKSSILEMFKSNSNEEKKQVLELTYSYEAWRIFALKEYMPLCQRVIDDWITTLSKYYSLLAQVYHQHIVKLIETKTKEKNDAAEQLSEEEKIHQMDNDWLTAMKDRIHLIERG